MLFMLNSRPRSGVLRRDQAKSSVYVRQHVNLLGLRQCGRSRTHLMPVAFRDTSQGFFMSGAPNLRAVIKL